jgi:hypothetical protein
MRKLLTFLVALGAAVFAVVSPASAQMMMTGAGSSFVPPHYQGPGDISVNGVVGAAQWWGFWSSARCWNAAYGTSHGAAMNLADQALANPITINCLSSGFVDVASINTWVTAHSVTTIFVTKLYDQTGSGHHLDTTGGTNANPSLTVSGLNGLPVMNFVQGISSVTTRLQTTSATLSFSQPDTFGAVAIRTVVGANGTPDGVIGTSNSGAVLGFRNVVANTAQILAGGTNAFFTANDNAWHAMNALFSGASSFDNIDGTDNATVSNIGTTGLSTSNFAMGASNAAHLQGKVAEGFVITSTSSPTDRGNLCHNQSSATFGYNLGFTC